MAPKKNDEEKENHKQKPHPPLMNRTGGDDGDLALETHTVETNGAEVNRIVTPDGLFGINEDFDKDKEGGSDSDGKENFDAR
jgi:hypothetical protein